MQDNVNKKTALLTQCGVVRERPLILEVVEVGMIAPKREALYTVMRARSIPARPTGLNHTRSKRYVTIAAGNAIVTFGLE
jgi:hypothetical protein